MLTLSLIFIAATARVLVSQTFNLLLLINLTLINYKFAMYKQYVGAMLIHIGLGNRGLIVLDWC